MKVFLMVFLVFLLFNCASGSTIVTGDVRPPINPADVKIYLDPPSHYETIGIVEAVSEIGFTRQAAQDRVIKELKAHAAKIGANGVLLTSTGSQSGGSTGFYSNGFFYSSASQEIIGQGRAIYVLQK